MAREGTHTHTHAVLGELVEALRSEAVGEPAKDLEVKYCSTQTVVEGGIDTLTKTMSAID